MATSPIYSWPEPDNTDLVKNGALAIRTLGNAIDTTMGTMVAKTIIDAKGDLIAGTAADTAARLAVGNNGETLVANSAAATGLSWAGQPYANPILNSAFQVWQRGTSIAPASTTAYTADRWTGFFPAGSTTVSRQVTGDTTNLPFIQYCARVQRDNGSSNTTVRQFTQSLETINSIPYAGKTVTVSFYARAGANFSSASNALNVKAVYGTGTDQNYTGTYTGATGYVDQNATLTTTWQRFTYSGTIAATATEIALQFQFTPTGTAGAADYFEITGVQIDLGSVALPFRTYAGTLAGELAACQRYYWRTSNLVSSSDILLPVGTAIGTTQVNLFFVPTVSMRTTPSAVDYANIRLYDGVNVFNSPTLAINTGSGTTLGVSATTTGLTQFRPYYLIASNGTPLASYVGLTAEL